MAGPDRDDLAVLLARVAGRDEAALKTLYDRTAAKLFGVIRRISVSEAAAEEALQEAWIRIWHNAERFDPDIAAPVTWMTTIARHAAIDALRKGSERISAATDVIDEVMIERLADPAAGGEPLAAGRQLARCLEGLEGDRRTMVLLAYCHGWSRDELSKRFDRPVATVKTLLRRSLIALKECLGGD